MKQIKLVILPDGSVKVFSEGAEGWAARDLVKQVVGDAKIVERHVGPHKHGTGHSHEEGEHTHA